MRNNILGITAAALLLLGCSELDAVPLQRDYAAVIFDATPPESGTWAARYSGDVCRIRAVDEVAAIGAALRWCLTFRLGDK
jgi:hypothetical protein